MSGSFFGPSMVLVLESGAVPSSREYPALISAKSFPISEERNSPYAVGGGAVVFREAVNIAAKEWR